MEAEEGGQDEWSFDYSSCCGLRAKEYYSNRKWNPRKRSTHIISHTLATATTGEKKVGGQKKNKKKVVQSFTEISTEVWIITSAWSCCLSCLIGEVYLYHDWKTDLMADMSTLAISSKQTLHWCTVSVNDRTDLHWGSCDMIIPGHQPALRPWWGAGPLTRHFPHVHSEPGSHGSDRAACLASRNATSL